MKKEATKKSKLWIWLVVGILALLIVAGAIIGAVAIFGGDGGEAGAKGGRAELYWNLDKDFYTENSESGLSTREPGEDGVYRIRFAYNGEAVELEIADKQLVNYIDTMDCMGLVKDSNGTVIDVVDPKTLATETARMFYVRKVEDGKIVLNSSMAMNGMNMDIMLTPVTEIYDVTDQAENPGQKIDASALKPMDSLTVYSNDKGEPTHVYVVSHPVESPIYWRADSGTYNSTSKMTTRTPDADGYYTIPFYVEGEYVELKCNVEGIVNTIDAKNRYRAHTGLVLDENGYIVDNMLAATGIRGLLGCDMFDVTQISDNGFTAEGLLTGKNEVYEGVFSSEVKIYNVSSAAKPDVRGKEIDSLELGDRVAVFENSEGEVAYVFVAHRLVDSPMYFNVTKKYNSTTMLSTRTPVNGWYTIEMMDEEGVIRTYKTQDKAIVDKIDSQNNRGVGLELDGDVITYVYEGECVAGYAAYVGYTVQTVTGSILAVTPPGNPDSIRNVIMNPSCKVFNMSGVKQEKGATTVPMPEDYCIMWRNPRSEIVYIYVIKRSVDAPVYFSVTRKWDSTTQSTTRVPDENGWYVYECIKLGSKGTVTVKTRSKSTADFLDSQSPQTFALQVTSDGVIYEHYETGATTGGSRAYLNNVVKRLDKLVTYYPVTEKVYTPKLAEGYKVYNLSGAVERYRGEPTTLQLNDNIQCYTNAKGEIALILVRQRKIDADIYFSRDRVKEVTEDGYTARVPDADGWYTFVCGHNGKEVTVKTKDREVATMMDAQSPQAFALKVDKDGVVQKAYAAEAATGGSTRAVNAVVQSVDGGKIIVKLTSGDLFEMPMAKSYKVYNVSGTHDNNFGEKTEIMVGDTLQSYTDSSNKVCYVFVKIRRSATKLYWNVDRQKGTDGSSRVKNADGYWYIDLAVDGQIKTFKVKSQSVIDYIDHGNSGAVAATLNGSEIISVGSALNAAGVAAAGKTATVKSISGKTVTAITGATYTLAADAKIYDVSGSSEFIGQYTTLKAGDYYRCYVNAAGELLHVYVLERAGTQQAVVYDNANLVFEEGTTKAKCTYCNKVVEWTAAPESKGATVTLENGGHYYLDKDMLDNDRYYGVEVDEKVCFHLNGHNITSSVRAFAVSNDGELTIMGNGVVTGSNTVTTIANVAAATISCRGNLNLIGGTYKHTGSDLPTILMARPQKTITMYDGVTLQGTEGVTGSNLFLAYGKFVMNGGTITGGSAKDGDTTGGMGGNLCILGTDKAGSVKALTYATLLGGTIDGGVYAYKRTDSFKLTVGKDIVVNKTDGGITLNSESGAVLTLEDMNEGAQVHVTGTGAITAASPLAATYVNTKILPAYDTVTLTAENDVIVAAGEVPAEPEYVWKLAWNVDPQYGADNTTTRTPDANGYYTIDLSIDGVTKTYKTNNATAESGITYVDESGASDRAVAIRLLSPTSDEFDVASGATNNTGATGAKLATIAAVDGANVSCVDSTELKIAASGQIFDVSDKATVEGELTALRAGDYGRFYTDANGDILYGYVYTRTEALPEVDLNTVCTTMDAMTPAFAAGGEVEAECPICQKTVTWKPMPAISSARVDMTSGHYYFDQDYTATNGYYNVSNAEADVNVCIFLNGKTFTNTGTANTRGFYVDNKDTLNVMGSGNIITARGSTTAAERCGSALEVSSGAGEVNICGGTWSKTSDKLDVIGARVRGEGSLNIYDGTVINIGEVEGNALWVAGANVAIHGGQINGDVYARVYTNSGKYATPTDLTVDGGTINGKLIVDNSKSTDAAPLAITLAGDPVIAELVADATLPVQIGRLTKGADIKVTADGVFTAKNANLQNYVDDGFLSAKAADKIVTVAEEVASVVAAPAPLYDNSDLVFETGTTKAKCTYCDEVVEWTALDLSGVTGSYFTLEEGGHYYLAEDLLNNEIRINSTASRVCFHLNGHDIQTVDNRAFSVQRDKLLVIMGNGNVSGGDAENAAISSTGNVVLIGGTYSCSVATQPVISQSRANFGVTIYDGVTINGNAGVKGSALNYTFGNLNLYGGNINGDIYVYGLTGSGAKVICKLLLAGGTVDGCVQVDNGHPETSSLTLAGDVKISAKNGGLQFFQPITLGALTEGAEVFVTADGEFTLANDRAADFLDYGYIKAAEEGKTVTEKDGVLSIG